MSRVFQHALAELAVGDALDDDKANEFFKGGTAWRLQRPGCCLYGIRNHQHSRLDALGLGPDNGSRLSRTVPLGLTFSAL